MDSPASPYIPDPLCGLSTRLTKTASAWAPGDGGAPNERTRPSIALSEFQETTVDLCRHLSADSITPGSSTTPEPTDQINTGVPIYFVSDAVQVTTLCHALLTAR